GFSTLRIQAKSLCLRTKVFPFEGLEVVRARGLAPSCGGGLVKRQFDLRSNCSTDFFYRTPHPRRIVNTNCYIWTRTAMKSRANPAALVSRDSNVVFTVTPAEIQVTCL